MKLCAPLHTKLGLEYFLNQNNFYVQLFYTENIEKYLVVILFT